MIIFILLFSLFQLDASEGTISAFSVGSFNGDLDEDIRFGPSRERFHPDIEVPELEKPVDWNLMKPLPPEEPEPIFDSPEYWDKMYRNVGNSIKKLCRNIIAGTKGVPVWDLEGYGRIILNRPHGPYDSEDFIYFKKQVKELSRLRDIRQ